MHPLNPETLMALNTELDSSLERARSLISVINEAKHSLNQLTVTNNRAINRGKKSVKPLTEDEAIKHFSDMSTRENAILQLTLLIPNYDDAGRVFGISGGAFKAHVHRIRTRLGAPSKKALKGLYSNALSSIDSDIYLGLAGLPKEWAKQYEVPGTVLTQSDEYYKKVTERRRRHSPNL